MLLTLLFVQYWVLFSMSCGIWQRILTSCTVFRTVPWKLCPRVETQCSGELGRTGTLELLGHTCPCPRVHWKLFTLVPGRRSCRWQESAQNWLPSPPELFCLVVPFGGIQHFQKTARREREFSVSLRLNLHAEPWLLFGLK